MGYDQYRGFDFPGNFVKFHSRPQSFFAPWPRGSNYHDIEFARIGGFNHDLGRLPHDDFEVVLDLFPVSGVFQSLDMLTDFLFQLRFNVGVIIADLARVVEPVLSHHSPPEFRDNDKVEDVRVFGAQQQCLFFGFHGADRAVTGK